MGIGDGLFWQSVVAVLFREMKVAPAVLVGCFLSVASLAIIT
jgi:hypothetical protein